MDVIELEFLDLAAAVALTMGLTQLIKQMSGTWLRDAQKFAPLYALLSAAIAVGVLIDTDIATQQDFVLAVVVVTLASIGAYSGVKNTTQAVRHRP